MSVISITFLRFCSAGGSVLQHLAPLEVVGKLAVPGGDMATLDGGHRPAPQGAALEQGEVRTAQQLAGVHGTGGPQVHQHQVRVAAGENSPLPGIYAEDPGGVHGHQGHQLLNGQLLAINTLVQDADQVGTQGGISGSGLPHAEGHLLFTGGEHGVVGADGVKAELTEKQLPENAINALADFIAAGEVTLDAVAARCADPAIADDLKYVLVTANAMAAGRYQVAYCPSLVRGQGYYTGMVFEITCPQFSGAVAGGGRYDNMVGKFLGTQVPAVGFSIGFERVCGILLEQGYQIPGAKQKIALLYGKDADFTAVLAKAADLRSSYNVTVLQQAKKLGKQLGQLEASGFSGAAFMDKDEIKIFAQQ